MSDDLVAWLTQIFDDTEARYRAIEDNGGYMVAEAASPLSRIAADRQILALHKPLGRKPWRVPVCGICNYVTASEQWPCLTTRLLASPYADRPGFRDGWRLS